VVVAIELAKEDFLATRVLVERSNESLDDIGGIVREDRRLLVEPPCRRQPREHAQLVVVTTQEVERVLGHAHGAGAREHFFLLATEVRHSDLMDEPPHGLIPVAIDDAILADLARRPTDLAEHLAEQNVVVVNEIDCGHAHTVASPSRIAP
jgi:hypothetical protein